MSIRRTIRSLLEDEQKQAEFQRSPETFFAEQGMEDLPGDLIGTSFVHYSDTAPIEHADAVAGIATHFSPVPLEAEDLPTFADTETDPFAALGSISDEPADRDDPGPEDAGSEDAGPTAERVDLDLQREVADSGSSDPHELDDQADPPADSGQPEPSVDHDGDAPPFSGGEPDEDASLGATARQTGEFDDGEFGMGFDDDPSGILGEIHGGGPLDPGADDPFFDDETEAVRAVVDVDVDVAPAVETMPSLADPEPVTQYDSFTEAPVQEFVDVDPGDLDLDEL